MDNALTIIVVIYKERGRVVYNQQINVLYMHKNQNIQQNEKILESLYIWTYSITFHDLAEFESSLKFYLISSWSL